MLKTAKSVRVVNLTATTLGCYAKAKMINAPNKRAKIPPTRANGFNVLTAHVINLTKLPRPITAKEIAAMIESKPRICMVTGYLE